MFEVNEKVVCIDDSPGLHDQRKLVYGRVYVVSGICLKTLRPTLYIVGHPVIGIDVGWRASRFRKLVDVQAENKAKRQDKKGVSGRAGAKGFSHQEP